MCAQYSPSSNCVHIKITLYRHVWKKHTHKPNQTRPAHTYRIGFIAYVSVSFAFLTLVVDRVFHSGVDFVHTHTWRLFLWFIQVNLRQAKRANKLLNWFRWHEYSILQTEIHALFPPISLCTWSIHAIQNGSNLAVKLESQRKPYACVCTTNIDTSAHFGSRADDHFKCRATAYQSDYKSVRFHFVRK